MKVSTCVAICPVPAVCTQAWPGYFSCLLPSITTSSLLLNILPVAICDLTGVSPRIDQIFPTETSKQYLKC